MCGIAGIIQSVAGTVGDDHLQKMTAALAHRGPDGEGYWRSDQGNVLFGHRRLSILDLSEAAAQPFHYLGRYTILHNGEIYNYIELRDELLKKGYRFRTSSDTEVLVAAFDCWREDCVNRFDGMFAFAIWDEKEKRFFCARDRFGEKPFFYCFDSSKNIFCFASEIKALRVIGLGGNFNRKMLFNFLTIGYTDNPEKRSETFFDNISKLPAASYISIGTDGTLRLVEKKYWELDAEAEDKTITDEEALEEFNELLLQSVQRRLRSDVAVGTSLSGGLDSSSIVAAIRESQPDAFLRSFSAVFPGFEKNEEKYIDEVSAKFSLQSFKISVNERSIPPLLQKIIFQQDEPFGSAGLLPQFSVFELAQKNNVKVLLDGQGSDEILAGYDKYYKWYWQELFRKGRLRRSGELGAAKKLGINAEFGPRNIMAALFPDLASVALERRFLLNALRQEDLTKEFVHQQSREAYYTTPAIFSLNGALHFNTCVHGLEELLRYADRNSMAHGREVRLPFLSHELVEFIFSLPASFKIRNGWTKWLLRKSVDRSLPESIAWRKDKIGFEPPQQQWMETKPVREMIQDARKKMVEEKILKPEVLEKPVKAAPAYAEENNDWRYLVSAPFL
jgi:asparagine synthase (glutamine-hydrolysing)